MLAAGVRAPRNALVATPVRSRRSGMMNSQTINDAGEAQNAAKTVAPGLWPALKGAAADWSAHKSAKAGAAIAYYSIFSIGPLIVVVISLAALFFGAKGSQQRGDRGHSAALLGDKGFGIRQCHVVRRGRAQRRRLSPPSSAPSRSIFAAVGVVVQLKEALNVVWEVKPKPGGGIWGFTRSYVLSLAGVLTVGFLLLVSMLLTAALSAFARTFGTLLPESLLQAAAFLVSFAAISALFVMMSSGCPTRLSNGATSGWAAWALPRCSRSASS